MKKIKYIIILGIVFLMAIVFFYNNNSNIDNYIVYIECIDNNVISSGSGFVYKEKDNKNYIITNYHVIEEYNEIYVYNKNRDKIRASVLKKDEYTDLAILVIEDKLGLNSAIIGNSNEININDNIYAIGTQDINSISEVTKGVITKLNKKISIDTNHGNSEFDVIEMNIGVDSGNSGGPILNDNNEIIGVVFIKDESRNNIAYAMPINFVLDIVEKLENNKINRPSLGAIMTNTTNIELMNEYGINNVEVTGVILLDVYDSYNYGLQKSDVITKLDNKDISNVNQLRKELYKFNKGDTVEIEYYRNNISYKVSIILQ